MKKQLSLPAGWAFVLLLAMTSCSGCQEAQVQKLQDRRNLAPAYRVVEIEGCEYLRTEVTHGYAVLTHKGNCRNPIHCRQDTTTRRPLSMGTLRRP